MADTIKSHLALARISLLAASQSYREPHLTYRGSLESAIGRLECASVHCQWILARTKDARTKRVAARLWSDSTIQANRHRASILASVEFRASHSEDREYWNSLGYRVFDVIDAHCFSTSSDPWYNAQCAVRSRREWLGAHGYQTMTESPDAHYIRWFDSYWGTRQSQQYGHIVLLIRADTPLDLELARREYLEDNRRDWAERLQMDFPHSGFREW